MLEGGKLFSPTKMKLSDSADRNLAVPAMKRLGSLRKKPAFQSTYNAAASSFKPLEAETLGSGQTIESSSKWSAY